MCFNPAITWATAGLGIAVGLFAKKKQKPAALYFPPIYFGLMEIIQGLMYSQLQDPNTLFVHILVYLAYIHVCFQPLVVNYWLGSFITKQQADVYRFTLKLSFVGGLFLLARIFITHDVPLCSAFESLCSATPTIYYGEHHIAWAIPLKAAGWKYVTPSIALHMFLFFIPGVLLGLYRLMLMFFILGPFLAGYITSDPNEQSSVWCVIGLWLLVVTILTAIYKPPRFLFPNKQE